MILTSPHDIDPALLLLLQVHYQIVRPEGDHTGVRLKLTRMPQPMSAGMLTYAVGFVVSFYAFNCEIHLTHPRLASVCATLLQKPA
jgi:hypothetical protein